MKKTGEILRQAREAKGLSINELALSLKINSKALTAIEEGDLTKLPARTFLRGFVQSYAQALKINVDEVLAVFSEEMGTTRPQPAVAPAPSPAAPTPTPTPTEPIREVVSSEAAPAASPREVASEGGLKELEESNRLRLALMTSLVLVLVLLIFGTKKVIDRYQREKENPEVVTATPLEHEGPAATETTPVVEPEKPADAAEAAAELKPTEAKPVEIKTVEMKPVEEKKIEPSAPAEVAQAKPAEPVKPVETPTALKPPPGAAPLVEKAPPAAPTPFQQALSLPTIPHPQAGPLRTESPAGPKKTGTESKPVETKPIETAEAKPVEEKKPEPAAPAETAQAKPVEEKKPVKKSIELIIEAMDTVDVEYVGTNGKSQKIHLDADQVHTIRSKSGLNLTVSNGGAVNLILNGRDIGVPGGLGSPVSLTY